MQSTEQDVLAAQVYALVRRFAELISVPRASIPVRRLGQHLDDSLTLASDIRVILSRESAAQKYDAYYFAPAYNAVLTTHIFGLAAAGYVRSTIEDSYRRAIETARQLVGNSEANDSGSLSDWVAAQTPGSASARTKIDRDPVVYCIRRFLDEAQSALE